jgi:hypothetical protein
LRQVVAVVLIRERLLVLVALAQVTVQTVRVLLVLLEHLLVRAVVVVDTLQQQQVLVVQAKQVLLLLGWLPDAWW